MSVKTFGGSGVEYWSLIGISMRHFVICNVKPNTLMLVFFFSLLLKGDVYSYKVTCGMNEVI